MRLSQYFNPVEWHRRRRQIRPWLRRTSLGADGLMGMAGLGLSERQRALRALRDIHAGRTGVLIGNGPSVRLADLERLGDAPTFCANRFHLAYPRTSFRPSYTVMSDRQMIEDFGQEVIDRCATPLFLCSDWPVSYRGNYLWLRLRDSRPWTRPSRLHGYIYQTGATLLAALQIGIYMGIRRFVVYGVDHSFHYERLASAQDDARCAVGEGNHFIANYRDGKPWAPPQFELIESSFRFYDAWLRRMGGGILNATRGGRLDVVRRIDFEEYLERGCDHIFETIGKPPAAGALNPRQLADKEVTLHT